MTIFIQEDKCQSVSKNPESSSFKAEVYVLSRLAFFKDELEAKKSLKPFFYSQNYN